ncbi:hypothetical protein [Paenibacillus wenxiniae]|uniref:Uncharacterized protein n=1 Tax=Paenibacillus wenxiniae TaxID=1636843 RepID=A0ABW4RN01_9BACL
MFNIPSYQPVWHTTVEEIQQNQTLMERLHALKHQVIQDSMMMWDVHYDEHNADAPFLVQLEHDQLEICCYKLDDMAISFNEIDCKQALDVLNIEGYGVFTYEWRSYSAFTEHFRGASILSLAIEEYGFETVVIDNKQFPEQNGTKHSSWLLSGLYITTNQGGFSVYNALDETGIIFGEHLEAEMLKMGTRIKHTQIF